MSESLLPSRKDFLCAIAGSALIPGVAAAQPSKGKLLIVAAHPDDEYAFAASTYRLARECGWIVDQAVVTNGESGYRYSSLAETYYGVSLAPSNEGRARLAEIRKQEARNAGKVLGIRRHYFLDQRDLGFTTDASVADTSNWNRAYLRTFLSDLLSREKYDAVFTLLPTAETHGHHRAATLLALEALAKVAGVRPLIFGAEPRSVEGAPLVFSGLAGEPLTRTVSAGARVSLRPRCFVRLSRVAELSDRGELAHRRAQITGPFSERLQQTPFRAVLAVRGEWGRRVATSSQFSGDLSNVQRADGGSIIRRPFRARLERQL